MIGSHASSVSRRTGRTGFQSDNQGGGGAGADEGGDSSQGEAGYF